MSYAYSARSWLLAVSAGALAELMLMLMLMLLCLAAATHRYEADHDELPITTKVPPPN